MTKPLSSHDRVRICAEGLVSEKTVSRTYRGEPVRELSRLRIERAAKELGLPLPPRQKHAKGQAA
jgi:DNA-binding LacI/PurR family transcriptional regulator